MVSLMPKDQRFFDLFEKNTSIAVEAARYLESLVGDLRDLEVRTSRLKELEHEGDVVTHDTIDRLNKTFLTPFDREDLHALTTELDEILDWIEEAGQRLAMYKVTEPRDDARRLAHVVVLVTEELHDAIEKLRDHQRNAAAIQHHLVEINRLENEGDHIFRQALSRLFEEDGLNPIQVLKWKEIYEALENAVDAVEQVAHVIDSVLVKHA